MSRRFIAFGGPIVGLLVAANLGACAETSVVAPSEEVHSDFIVLPNAASDSVATVSIALPNHSVAAATSTSTSQYTVTPDVVWVDGTRPTRPRFRVRCNRPAAQCEQYRVVSSETWARSSSTGTYRGNRDFIFEVAESPSFTANREVKVEFFTTRSGKNVLVARAMIRQRPSVRPTISPRVVSVPAAGGNVTVNVTVPGTTRVVIYESPTAGIALGGERSVERSGPVTFTVRQNTSAARRIQLLASFGTAPNPVFDTLYIDQEAGAPPSDGGPETQPTLKVTPTNASIASAGGQVVLSISAQPTQTWRLSYTEPWLSLAGTSPSGQGNGARTLVAAPNSTTLARTAVVSVNSVLVRITQAAGTPIVQPSVTPRAVRFAAEGGSAILTVTAPAGTAWSATRIASPTNSWLRYDGATSGRGNGSVRIFASANKSVGRTGTIRVAGSDIAISQDAAPLPPVSVTPTALTLSAAGGPATVSINAASGQPWTTTTPTATWLRITTATAGTGATTLRLAVDANVMMVSRQATFSINQQTITVTQGPAPTQPAAFEVKPGTVLMQGAGDQQTVSIEAPNSNNWSLSGFSDSWLSIFGGTYGTGTQTRTLDARVTNYARGTAVRLLGSDGREFWFRVLQAGLIDGMPSQVPGVLPASTTLTIPAATFRATLTVSAPSGTCWSVTALNSSWLSVLGGTRYCGAATITFDARVVTANSRGTVVSVGGTWVTIIQRGTIN